MSLDGSLAEAVPASPGPPPGRERVGRLGERLLERGVIILDRLEVAR